MAAAPIRVQVSRNDRNIVHKLQRRPYTYRRQIVQAQAFRR